MVLFKLWITLGIFAVVTGLFGYSFQYHTLRRRVTLMIAQISAYVWLFGLLTGVLFIIWG